LVVLSPDSIARERHGVFVGNCRSACVENNVIELTRVKGAENLSITGAVLYGYLGKRVLVRGNHLIGFSAGVNLTPRYQTGANPYPPRASVLWLVADNMFESVTTPVVVGRSRLGVPAPVDMTGNKNS